MLGTLEEEQDKLLQHLPLAEHLQKIVLRVEPYGHSWKLVECSVGLVDFPLTEVVLGVGSCQAWSWERIE